MKKLYALVYLNYVEQENNRRIKSKLKPINLDKTESILLYWVQKSQTGCHIILLTCIKINK